jgi:hypothetical protein
MITHQVSIEPAALLFARGGSIGRAAEITGHVLREMVANGATPAYGLEPRAAWVAIIGYDTVENPGVEVVDWDPTEPIPKGALMLRCTGYAVSTLSEDAG